eukprot:CFRG4765T1
MSILQSVIAIMALTVQLTGTFTSAVAAPVAISEYASENSDYRPTARIVGGAPVAKRIPFMVSLYNTSESGDDGRHYCGGTLIAKDWVLTAGHCVRRGMAEVSSHTAYIGMITKSKKDYLHKSGFAEVVLHPELSRFPLLNDIALIRLKDPAPKDSVFVSLNENKSVPKNTNKLWYAGWGRLYFDGSDTVPDTLQSVSVDVLSNWACRGEYSRTQITDNTMCTDSPGTGANRGDSGGPLILPGKNDDISSGVQVGIVSWSSRSKPAEMPQICTRVSSYIDWIKSTIHKYDYGLAEASKDVVDAHKNSKE